MKHTRNILLPLISAIFVAGVVYAADGKGHPDAGAKAMQAKHGSYVEPKINHGQYGAMKIVVPITTDDKAVQGMKLRNMANGLDAAAQWGGQMHGTIVLYAKGVSLLSDPDPETRQKIDALKAKGVQFAVCDNTLREQGIDFHQLYHVVERDIVPSGFVEVAYLQSTKNYVVDPIN
jgi:uncharacterized protein